MLTVLDPFLVGVSSHCLHICKTTELGIIMRSTTSFPWGLWWLSLQCPLASCVPIKSEGGWVVYCSEGVFLSLLGCPCDFLFPRFRNSTGVCFGTNDDHFSWDIVYAISIFSWGRLPSVLSTLVVKAKPLGSVNSHSFSWLPCPCFTFRIWWLPPTGGWATDSRERCVSKPALWSPNRITFQFSRLYFPTFFEDLGISTSCQLLLSFYDFSESE